MTTRPRARVALVCACAVLWVGCWSTRPLQPGDRDYVLRVGHLEPSGLEIPAEALASERLRREVWFDGSVMLDYEFFEPDLELPYVASSAAWNPRAEDGCLGYGAVDFGSRFAGIEIQDRNDLFQYGDRSRFGLLVHEGEPYGMFYNMCRDHVSFFAIVGGLYADDPEILRELFLPIVRRLPNLR